MTWLKRAAKLSPAVAVALLAVFWRFGVQHWLALHTGSSNMPGTPPNYNFFSGSGSDLSELAIVGAVLGAYRKHNCHAAGCWRIGRHVVDGTPWCDRHQEDARQESPSPGLEERLTGLITEHHESVHARLDAIQAAQHPPKRTVRGKGAQEAGPTGENG